MSSASRQSGGSTGSREGRGARSAISKLAMAPAVLSERPEEIEAANSNDPAVARKALEKLLEKNPRNAMLLARLGASYRTDDPARSLDFYRKASEIQPDAPSMRSVTVQRWSRRVAFLKQHTSCNK